jgi:ABC-type branched-subunit amino acid transport system ATPase component/ABC-type branched-subunit amino acid transport system permease subunit
MSTVMQQPAAAVVASSASTAPAFATPVIVVQVAILTCGGALAILLAGDGPHQVTIALTLIYITYASAWNIVAGFAGQFTFGHSAFFGLGAYAATLLTQWTGTPPLFGLWVGVAAAAAAAAAIGMITLKLRGLYFGLVTAVFPIVFAVFATYLGFQEVSVPYRPGGGVAYFSPDDPRVLSAVALGAAILVVVIAALLVRSRFGLYLGALRADQDAAEASGIGTTRVKIYALVLSAGLSAIAGGIYASVSLVVTPVDVFGLQMSVKPVLFSVFGGIGTLAGPVVGAAILVPLSEALTATFGAALPGLSGLIYGAALLLVITLFPAGVVPVLTSAVGATWGRRRGAFRERRAGSFPGAAASSAFDALTSPASAAYGTEDIATPSAPAIQPPPDEPAILEIQRISKAFGGTQVLQDVTIAMARGEILGVIGPNGAGKTTLFNVVNGFLRPDAGAIRLSGRDVTNSKPSTLALAGVGRTFQTVRLFTGMSAFDNVRVAALARHLGHREASESTWQALGEIGLRSRAQAKVEELTTGELRRLELARAMATAGPTGLLLLDEFLGGLAKADGVVLLGALVRWRERGGSILAIEHTMRAMAGFVDRFVVLDFGKVIAEGPPDAIWRNRDVVKAYLGEKWVA